MSVLEKIKNDISTKTVDEILYEDLLNFYQKSSDEISYDDIKEKFVHEMYNETERDIEYFRQNISDMKCNIEQYCKVVDMLKDEKSKEVFENMMAAKMYMDMDYIQKAFSEDAVYFNEELFQFGDEEVLIDCGGYVGDSAISFANVVPKFSYMYIMECNPQLAQKCTENLSRFQDKYEVCQYAASDANGVVHFQFETNALDAGKISETGDIEVKSICLDDLTDKRITFIKMDIEGAEKAAIIGAKRIIGTYTPKMAICIYHLNDDFWKIPQQIAEISPNYDFYIRQHDKASYNETVLYCVPKTMKACCNTSKYVRDDFLMYSMGYRVDRIWFLRKVRLDNNKIESYKNELDNLKEWCAELETSRSWLERQKDELTSNYEELHNWCEELTEAREWLNSQCIQKDEMIVELQAEIDKMRACSEKDEKVCETNICSQDEVEALKLQVKKLSYKLNKLESNEAVKKIIKKSNLYY